MRVVLDTSVLVAGLRSPAGLSASWIGRFIERRCGVLSVPLCAEYEAKGTVPEVLAAGGLRARDVTDIIDAMVKTSRLVTRPFLLRPSLPDPQDEMVLETAVAGSAEVIVTFNLRDFQGAERYGVRVLKPIQATEWMDGRSRREEG